MCGLPELKQAWLIKLDIPYIDPSGSRDHDPDQTVSRCWDTLGTSQSPVVEATAELGPARGA